MKPDRTSRGKAALLFVLTLLLLALTILLAFETARAYRDWQLNRYSVQERLYEAVGLFYAFVQLLVLSASLLALSAAALARVFRPGLGEKAVRWVRKRWVPLTLAAVLMFAVLFAADRSAAGRIAGTVETSEAPATLSDRVLRGRLQIGAELAAEAAILFLIWGVRGRRKKNTSAGR